MIMEVPVIRDAVMEDCTAVEQMIKELGAYGHREEGPNGPIINRKVLERDGFGPQRLLRIIVAEMEATKKLIGYALYFFKYSTYTGKILFLEDIYVKSDYRHLGTGQQLMKSVTKVAAETHCDGVEWACDHLNHDSIKFYKRFGGQEQPENKKWIYFLLDKQQIDSIAKE